MSSIPCNNCRRSKKKCSRERPCSLCRSQSVECIYNKVNLYKKRNTNKISKIFYRADKLEAVLKSALEKDYKLANLHIKYIIDHWNHVNLRMNGYIDSNMPIALAWDKIKGSLSNRSVRSFALIKRADKYQDHLILYNIYITYLHPHFPFINPQRILLLLELAQYDNPLLTSTLCRAQLFWLAMNNYEIPNLDEMELYIITIKENSKNEANISLEAIQTNINLALMEIHRYQIASLNKHIIAAIYISHQLGLHDLQSVAMDEEYEEKECAWSLLKWLDFIIHILLCQPRLFSVDSNFHVDPYPSPISYDKCKIFYSASSYAMRRYASCVSLNWDFPKNIKEFQLNTISECTAQHFIEMLSRVKTYVDIDMDLDLVKEPNTQGSTANLWRLAQFVKCCVLIIDICELLGRYYRYKTEIRQKYLKVQHEYSLKLIEAMFPQLTNSGATNIQYFEFIDPLYPIAAFHACKILLEDNIAISKEYFSYSYEHCVKSFKLFKCNWVMERFFTHFGNHPYLIQLNKELKIHKSYLSSSSPSSYTSPPPYDIYFQDTGCCADITKL